MALVPVCDGVVIVSNNGSMQCRNPDQNNVAWPWRFVEYTESDVAGLIDLLTFDSVTFGALLGTCIVIFIMGYSAGHVARLMGRV